MGIFGSISAINRANKQLKKIEYELDELIGEIQSGIYYSASSLRMRHQQIQRDIEVFSDIIFETTTSMQAPYFFKRQKFHPMALAEFLGSVMRELDAEIAQRGG